jgi:hypothetical protein
VRTERPTLTRRGASLPILVALPPLVIFSAIAIGYTFFATAGTWEFRDTASAYFDALGASFLHGRLYLPDVVPDALLALSNPYDPLQRATVTPTWPWDSSLYSGHLYLYWGPAPAVLHAIWHLRYSAPLFEGRFALLVGLATCFVFWLLIERLRRRAFPRSPHFLVWGSVLAFGLGGMMPYLIGRPSVYHSPILLAMFGLMGALFCLAEAIEAKTRRRLYLCLSGALLGWALASRVTYVAYAVGVGLILCITFVRSRANRGQAVLDLTAFGMPLVLTAFVLLAYNWARFDSPFEFGTKYQLAGTDQTSTGPTCGRNLLGYVGLYFLSVPRVATTYPFVTFTSGPALSFGGGPAVVFPPSRFTATIPEEPPIMSVFLLVPVGALVLSAPFFRRDRILVAGAWAVLGAVVLGMVATTGVLTCVNGVDARYFGDLAPPLGLAGAIMLLAWSDRLAADAGQSSRHKHARAALYAFAVAGWISTVAVGLLLGTVAWLYWAPLALNHLLSGGPAP